MIEPGPNHKIAVIGSGPSGLMAADVLSAQNFKVTVFEQKPNAGRKFLLAGRSGLNLTHDGDLAHFIRQYGEASSWLQAALENFRPSDVVAFSEQLGQPCFIGSSRRIFPVGLKATHLLRAWLRRLTERGVEFKYNTRWTGFGAQNALLFEAREGSFSVAPDATILALGGASWPRTGSNGQWVAYFPEEDLSPFQPANCGFHAAMSEGFFSNFHGDVLHGVKMTCGDAQARGDVTVTRTGFEGAPIYALSAQIRDRVAASGEASVIFDLRPDLTETQLRQNLRRVRPRESRSNQLRRLGLTPVERALSAETSKDIQGPVSTLYHRVSITLTGAAGIERAISVAGGLRQKAFDARFMLRSRPGVFVAGEMLDWEAPTGGYLLQACFSTGYCAGVEAGKWLKGGAV